MTIQDLGSLGELIAAVATVATLAYLAIQIRQSTLATRVANHQVSIASSQAMLGALYRDRDFAASFARGISDFDSLTQEEQTQLHFFLAQVVLFYKDCLQANEAGILDDETMSAREKFAASIVCTAGGRVWWGHASNNYIEIVRTRLSQAMESATPYNETLPFLRPRPPAV